MTFVETQKAETYSSYWVWRLAVFCGTYQSVNFQL